MASVPADCHVPTARTLLTHSSRDDRRKQRGAIVNIASILGQFSCQSTTAYVSSKHAVCGLTKSASFENSSKGVRVNAIAPGWIDTPVSRMGAGDRRWLIAVPAQPVVHESHN